ncbi:MAG: AAA family ATPase [Bryobacteraceae bacterium]|jgi:predicted kinase
MRIIVLVGLPGSGKSTYLEKVGGTGLASDKIRLWLADDETDQSAQGRVFQTLRYLLRQRLEIGRPVTYIDATNLTVRERRPYLEIARKRGCTAEAVFFDVPFEVCCARNRRRRRVVPDDVLMRMSARLSPPTAEEGFARITVVRG